MTSETLACDRAVDSSASDWSFTTSDGVHVAYSRRSGGHRVAVLVVPGMLMTRACAEHRALASQLSAVADVFTIDARGHGDSGGRISFGAREPMDVADLALQLRQTYDVVVGLGFSLGGYHVLAAEAERRVFDAIAIAGTPTHLRLLSRGSMARTLLRSIPMVLRRRHGWHRVSLPSLRSRPPSALALVETIAPTPLLIMHGGKDWLVPSVHAHLLYNRALEPKELAIVPEGKHAESLISEHSGVFVRRLSTFIEVTAAYGRSQLREERTPLNVAVHA